MTPEVKTALERVQRNYCGSYTEKEYAAIYWKDDSLLLTEAFVAEHPADDSESITEQWLLSIGYRKDGNQFSNQRLIVGKRDDSTCDVWILGSLVHVVAGHVIHIGNTFTTRGELRLLMRALKIDVKEQNKIA